MKCLLCSFLLAASPFLLADDWPQWRGPDRDGTLKEEGLVAGFEPEQLVPRWTARIGGGYAGPTVAGDRVVVFDRLRDPDRERVLCFDRHTGGRLWEHTYDCPYNRVKYPAGPRAAVTLHGDRALALGSTGRLHCLDLASGEIVWARDLLEDLEIDLPIWGIAAAPLVDGDQVLLQIGGKGACVVSLDLATGETRWRALDDPASYSAPVMIRQGGRKVLACWTGTRMVGLDPADGKELWAEEVGFTRWVIAIATPVVRENRLFVTATDKGSLMLALDDDTPAARVLWRRGGDGEDRTDALHSLMCTPVFEDGHLYGISKGGVLRCLDARNGDRVWADETATSQTRFSSLHLVKQADRYWLFNDQGELILAELSPEGYREIDRAKLIAPTRDQNRGDKRGVTWSHPAFAHGHVFARSDEELVCVDLRKPD